MRIQMLRAFLKVVETQNFTTAAEELFISQSTLSKQIAELERSVGQQLFFRSTRSVRPTAAGTLFFRHAVRIVREWDTVLQEMNELYAQKRNNLSIGYTTSEHLQFVFKGMRKKEWIAQNVEISMCKEHPDRVLQLIRDGQMDCAVMHRPSLRDSTDMDARNLIKTTMHVMISKENPLSKERILKLEQLSKEVEVRLNHDDEPAYHDAIDEAYARAGVKPPACIETKKSEEIRIVANQIGAIAMVPAIYPAWEGYVSLPIEDFSINFDFVLARSLSNKNPLIDMLADVISEAAKPR